MDIAFFLWDIKLSMSSYRSIINWFAWQKSTITNQEVILQQLQNATLSTRWYHLRSNLSRIGPAERFLYLKSKLTKQELVLERKCGNQADQAKV